MVSSTMGSIVFIDGLGFVADALACDAGCCAAGVPGDSFLSFGVRAGAVLDGADEF